MSVALFRHTPPQKAKPVEHWLLEHEPLTHAKFPEQAVQHAEVGVHVVALGQRRKMSLHWLVEQVPPTHSKLPGQGFTQHCEVGIHSVPPGQSLKPDLHCLFEHVAVTHAKLLVQSVSTQQPPMGIQVVAPHGRRSAAQA